LLLPFFILFMNGTIFSQIIKYQHENLPYNIVRYKYMVMVFKATFNNMSVKSWQSVLMMEETRVPEENHRPVASY
jgi:hypothetical protein